ncbi:9088_t:CDS:2 [Funneliformis geosporum]|uniref:9088_t:CDS:1 n=1 Tax=Funneliformis geosporum TaxID=1117311 RepID=A0A9W4SFJ0_9GLOM|nr:9088_t:CDS:2 [Funneliformis geosporum]
MVMMIPKVLSIPFPQQSSTRNSPNFPVDEPASEPEPEKENHLLYWIFGIIGIAVFVEIIYWIYRCIHLLRKGFGRNDNNYNIQSANGNYINNLSINRRRGLFDTPSYAGSIDEELPPYEGFSLPKYNHIINENISSNEGDRGSIVFPRETIQMIELDLNSNSDDNIFV